MRISVLTIILFSFCFSFCITDAHNITRILAKNPEFSTFNHYLTLTHLASEINRRETITVLALDNAAMSKLLKENPSLGTVANVLSLHVVLDYFDTERLHQISNGTALAATLFQATGDAPGSTGFINITDLSGGKVGFGAEDNGGYLNSTFVKTIRKIPYNISVIQISQPISSPEAEAPAPAPAELNLTALLSANGCKRFVELMNSSGALSTFRDNIDSGLTVFCPSDKAVDAFMPRYKNLTKASKRSVVLFHGVPYYQSLGMLKSNNGAVNTLATDGKQKFQITVQNDGEVVTLKTKINTAKITGTVTDKRQTVAAFAIDKVLLPKEIFKAEASVTSPAPAPAPTARSPKSKSRKPESPAASPADTPADGPADDIVADDESGSGRLTCPLFLVLVATAGFL